MSNENLKNPIEKNKAFTQHRVNGFYLRFPNGNELSTIWGIGSHTENHHLLMEMYQKGIPTLEETMKHWNNPLASNDVEVMPTCSDTVKKLLDATFPANEDGVIFNNLTFDQWLKMVNILNENK